jgi:DNA-binding response OmpR family regulator
VRLLVAEDEGPIRDLLVRGLSETGYVVDSAENGGDALHLLRLYDYAAAVIDWRMPEMTGVEVIRAARSHHLAVPVLMLTARDALSGRARAWIQLNSGVWLKPAAQMSFTPAASPTVRRSRPGCSRTAHERPRCTPR